MIFRRGSIGLLAGCLVVAICGRMAAAEDGGGARRIAVVNVSRVFEAYTKVKDVQDKMKNLFDANKQALENDGKKLKDLEDRLRIDPRNPKDVEMFKEIQAFELRKLMWESEGQKLGQRVEEQRKVEMKSVLSDIKNAIRTVGTAMKYDLVLRAPEFDDEFDKPKNPNDPEESKISAGDLVRRFRENPVLYFSQGVDVTEAVIKKLNDDYVKPIK